MGSKKLYEKEKSQYLEDNPTWHVEDSPWKAKQIHKILNRNSLDLKSVAEIGCGVGEILNQLHTLLADDIIYTGYDIAPDAIKLAKPREKERLKFKLENLLEVDAYFDLLLMIDVFEHVEDYLGFIKACKGKSKYMIFHIPLDIHVQGILRNLPMRMREKVGHLHYFTKDTAISTLEDCGYEVIDYFYTAGSIDLQKTFKSKLLSLPRRIMYKINKDLTQNLLGGFSLLVLAKNK